MREDFIHYIWQYQYFEKPDLKTSDGKRLTVFRQGVSNTDAGADFHHAHIKIDTQELIGDIEIHIKSSDWKNHQHHKNKAYESVILHVVWELNTNFPTNIPILELKNHVSKKLLIRYQQFISNKTPIPCHAFFTQAAHQKKLDMIDKALEQRFERKNAEFLQLLERNNDDWEETTYQLLGKNFGFKLNAEPFFQLCKTLPLKTLQKHADQPQQIEALLFGQAGFLNQEFTTDYPRFLQQEYDFLSKKYALQNKQLARHQWKFLRLRPANFPTVRLAQFANLIQSHQHLYSKLLTVSNTKELQGLFESALSPYWQTHYDFEKEAKKALSPLGKQAANTLLINTVPVLLMAKNKQQGLEVLKNALAEQNKITKLFKTMGLHTPNAYFSQAVIEWHNAFCKTKKCLECEVGKSILRLSAS